MKRSFLFPLLIAVCAFFGCTKEYVTNNYYGNKPITDSAAIDSVLHTPISNIVYTDAPPENLFVNGQAYGVSYTAWITQEDLDSSIQVGYYCLYNNGANNDCGAWRQIACRKYWGMTSDGQTVKVYVSEGKDWYAMGPDATVQVFSVLQKKHAGLGMMWAGYDSNPIGNPIAIQWMQ